MARTGLVSPVGCDSPEFTRLITLRGNSASGKSTVAAEIRTRFGRGLAIVALSDRPIAVRDVRRACRSLTLRTV